MRYMMMMNVPAGAGTYKVNDWAPEDFKAHIAFMHDFAKELKAAGEWLDGQGLAPPNQAKLVVARGAGAYQTDGPFAETKEFLAGYWLVEVESEARALELAARASAAPGPRGVPLNMPIEVRQVLQAPSTDA
jgi:hypothetical protein